MKDLTTGSVESHLFRLAVPIGAGMLFQTLYFIVDLYFVAHVGKVAMAGVGAAGNIVFLVMALTQMINAGTLALLSQAVGRKDRDGANLVFNQAWALAATLAVATLIVGYPLSKVYMGAVSADGETIRAGLTYLAFYMPGLALQFILGSMSSALRASGLVRPTMVVLAISLSLNIALAPVLIAGWFTGHPMGVAGAGLASSVSLGVGVGLLTFYYLRLETYMRFVVAQWRPRLAIWRRLLLIGMPAGGEIAFLFLYTAVIFALIRQFGDAAQAGFGIGNRLTQAIFLPGMAIAFAAGPIVGQNYGAGHTQRVRITLRAAIVMCSAIMVLLTLLCQVRPEWLIHLFTPDRAVVAQGALFLQTVSWNFVATGIIFCCSALFQGLGNTWPALMSTGSRLLTFVLPASLLAIGPHFRIEEVWYLSVATVSLQALTSLYLVAREIRGKLAIGESPADSVAGTVEI